MLELTALVSYLDELLHARKIDDYCPNGLQVEGARQIEKVVTGVTASQQLIEQAIKREADAILVHHGYFWKGEDQRIVGNKQQRLKKLLAHDISLIAYHLPLDLHAEVGNNVQLAKLLGWKPEDVFCKPEMMPLLRTTVLQDEQSGEQLANHLRDKLQREPLHIPAERPIRRIAWCTGAAQSYLARAVALGVDAFVTGEVSEPTVHEARESGIHFFAAGHHATERYGIRALGDRVEEKFAVSCEFVDCDNPV